MLRRLARAKTCGTDKTLHFSTTNEVQIKGLLAALRNAHALHRIPNLPWNDGGTITPCNTHPLRHVCLSTHILEQPSERARHILRSRPTQFHHGLLGGRNFIQPRPLMRGASPLHITPSKQASPINCLARAHVTPVCSTATPPSAEGKAPTRFRRPPTLPCQDTSAALLCAHAPMRLLLHSAHALRGRNSRLSSPKTPHSPCPFTSPDLAPSAAVLIILQWHPIMANSTHMLRKGNQTFLSRRSLNERTPPGDQPNPWTLPLDLWLMQHGGGLSAALC